MALTAAALVLGAAAAGTTVGLRQKAKRDQRRADREARQTVLADQRQRTRGAALSGQGGSGTLLTGAGGLSDPALTGKNTLLGTQ